MNIKFKEMLAAYKELIKRIPDNRNSNRTYSQEDILLHSLALFYNQGTSFLNYENTLENKKLKTNIKKLFLIDKLPSANQARNIIDKINYNFFIPIFKYFFEKLPNKQIEEYKGVNQNLLIAIDGTGYFSSNKIHCKNCLTKKHDDNIRYQHHVLMSGIVSTGVKPYIPLAPEFLKPQRNHNKQDCEIAAAKRWIKTQGKYYARYHSTILGDALYANLPIIRLLLQHKLNYIFSAKESKNINLYRIIEDLTQSGSVIKKLVYENKTNFFYSYINNIYLNDYSEKENVKVNWCEVRFTNKGKSHRFAFITNHNISNKNIVDIIKAGRARWKVENQNNHVLKNNGYNIEHNYGHGKNYLSMNLLLLNLIAFSMHTLLMMNKNSDLEKLKNKYGARYNVFNFIRNALAWVTVYSFESVIRKLLSASKSSLEEPP